MEQNNLPVIAKKLWSIVRVAFFMLRKGISKRKLMLDLNLMMKRGKLASKALSNLMFHHHHQHAFSSSASSAAQREYEFSCSNTPNYPFPFPLNKRRGGHHGSSSHFFNFNKCAGHAPATQEEDDAASAMNNVVKAVLEILNNHEAVEGSPMPTPFQTPYNNSLPGFGRSPCIVRQLRITDSPFPLRESTDEDNSHVDKAAEEFIERFYNNLRQQIN